MVVKEGKSNQHAVLKLADACDVHEVPQVIGSESESIAAAKLEGRHYINARTLYPYPLAKPGQGYINRCR